MNPPPPFDTMLEYIQAMLDQRLFSLNNTDVTFMTVALFVLALIVIFVVSSILNKRILRKLLERFGVERSVRYSLVRLSHYVFVFVGLLIAFQFVGIDLSGLAVIFGFLSVGIGFGLQNITSNFISGLILMIERPIKVGDRVVVDEYEGDVIAINMRATHVRTINNRDVIVPNSQFISETVTNWSHGNPIIRLNIPVGVSYSSNLDTVLKALQEVIDECKEVLPSPKAEIHFDSFGDSSWNLIMRIWIPDVTRHPNVRSDINMAIVRKFRAYEIEIPFPQRDLHVRSPLPLPLTQAEAGNGQ